MAKNTNLNIRSYTFYQVFPRQHSKTQDFKGIEKDLDRIKSMGVDVIYLLPIHPIGKKARKGTKGSPYSIVDYYAIDESLGTLEDFKSLVTQIHKRNMKVMMDIVFNHTSRDSKLSKEHPEWFYKNASGEFANRVGDWSDIADLDFRKREVWDYLINVLLYWAPLVDGFRCDVAPLLPIEFWIEAREKVNRVNHEMIWLSEFVHPGFVKYIRDMGYDCSSDSQMYEAFDVCYDYDIFDFMLDYFKDKNKLSRWLEELFRQEAIYPKNYIKLRSFENHDQARLRSQSKSREHFMQMVALNFFIKGPAMVYAGMEHEISHRPQLFEDDLILWNKANSIECFIEKLAKLKKQPLFINGNYHMHHSDKVAVLSYTYQNQFLIGIFNLEEVLHVEIPLIDGTYTNFIDESSVIVKGGVIELGQVPIIIDTIKEHIK